MKRLLFLLILLTISSCGVMRPRWKTVRFTEQEISTIKSLKVEEKTLKKLTVKPLYKFSEKELDLYLGYLYLVEPDLRARVQHLARKAINQPYDIYLLGEFPIEIYDPEPLFSLKKSDCVVFSEHVYAMALAYDWKSFFAYLQRIRYKNGEISLFTRNHYTEYDWDINNSWLVQDITKELVGEKAEKVISVYDKAKFFENWGLKRDIPVDTLEWYYIPYKLVPGVMDKLQPGDFVNVVRGNDSLKWVGHVGLITKSDDGTVNFLHSTSPKVKEQSLLSYIQESLERNARNEKRNKKRKNSQKPLPYFYGFKFLRLRDDPWWELIKMDGFEAPRVTIPAIY